MCHELYLRRGRESDESRAIWQDFERARMVGDREPREQVSDPDPTDAREEVALSER